MPEQRNLRTTSVFIKREPEQTEPKIFFCHICRTGVFQYVGDVITMIPGDAHKPEELKNNGAFPFTVMCQGSNPRYGKCKTLYTVQGFVDVE